MHDLAPVFDDIYRSNAWAGRTSRSGPGSDPPATARVALAIAVIVRAFGIRTVLDAACGDGRWFPDLPTSVEYTGLDVSVEAIVLARANRPDRVFMALDVRDHCPGVDLVVLRDALQHLPLRDGLAVLDRIRASGSRWLLASTFIGGTNVDIRPGDAYSPNLEALPFSMPRPALLHPDGFAYDDPDAIRDGRKMLGLWRLPG